MGGLGKAPLGYDYNAPMRNAMQLAQFARQMRGDQEEEEYRRARLAQYEAAEKRQLEKEQFEVGQKRLRTDIETATGTDPAKDPDVLRYFGERAGIGYVPSQPETRPLKPRPDVSGSLERGRAAMLEAARKEAALLPEDEESKAIKRQVEEGLLIVPKAVMPAYEARIKAGKEAQGLRVARRTEEDYVREMASRREKLGYETEDARIKSIYAQPLADLDVANKQATVDKLKDDITKARIELGVQAPVPGSPIATDIEQKQQQLNVTRWNAKKAELEVGNLLAYDKAKQLFMQTGKAEDLDRAILLGTNGVVDFANLRRQGAQFTLEQQKAVLASADRTWKLRVQLQELVNSGAKPEIAEPIIKEMNAQNLLHASIANSPVVNWTSIRQSEGWFPGKPITGEVKMRREEALALQEGRVRPDSALQLNPAAPDPSMPVSSGLMLLLKANYADLVNRADSGDPLAFKRLKEVANAYPGVSKEAADEATAAISRWEQKRMKLPPADITPAPITVPRAGPQTLSERERVPEGAGPDIGKVLKYQPVGPRPTGLEAQEKEAQAFKERLGGEEPKPGTLADRRNARAIAKHRRPYRGLTKAQQDAIDAEVQ